MRYEFIDDIYYLAGDDEPEIKPELIDIRGQRHLRFIKEYKHSFYLELLMTGKLNGYLADIDRKAEDTILPLMEEMAHKEGLTEQLKVENQMECIEKMNNICDITIEAVNTDLIYT